MHSLLASPEPWLTASVACWFRTGAKSLKFRFGFASGYGGRGLQCFTADPLAGTGAARKWLVDPSSTTPSTGATAQKRRAPAQIKSAILSVKSRCCGLPMTMRFLPRGPQNDSCGPGQNENNPRAWGEGGAWAGRLGVSSLDRPRLDLREHIGDLIDIRLLVVDVVERAGEAHGVAGIVALVELLASGE